MAVRHRLALIAGALLLALPAAAQDRLTVKVDGGKVQGAEAGGVQSWKGIPFAAPPVGANRWRAPQPVVSWPGARDATRYGHDCMQKPFASDAAPLGTEPSEDCLVVNVWRPANAPANAKLPVLVWIYGGGFVNGGSSPAVYDGKHFAGRGIIFVSFNYRLGRFGFFAHPALGAAKEGPQGNFAYMDQIAALQWIQRNISAFGGDPTNVTVFGESAGGASALNVLTSPATRGLFRRVAVLSGGGRAPLLPARKLATDQPGVPSAESVGVAFAHSAGIEGTGPDALAKLRALPAEQVINDLNLATLGAPQPTYVGGPIEDGVIVTGSTQALLETGKQAKVPVMIGTTSADIGFAIATSMDEALAPFGSRMADARKAWDPAGTGDFRAVGTAISMDANMTEPARYVAGMVAGAGQPAWYYRFSYVAEAMRNEWKSGAPHASDIPWFFDTIDAKYGDKLTDADRAVGGAANAYLTAFAKSGDPNGAGLPAWKPYSTDSRFLMDFAPAGPVGGRDPWTDRLDLIEGSRAPR